MVRQTAKVIFLEVLGVVSLLLMAAVAFLAIRLASGPVELGFLEARVEAALTDARNGRPVSIERLTLQWDPSSRRIDVIAYEISLIDSDGVARGYGDEARIVLDAGALFGGQARLLKADLRQGWLDIQNTGPNLWVVAGSPMPEIQARALPQSPQEWLGLLNRLTVDLKTVLGNLDQTVSAEDLSFTDMDIRVYNSSGDLLGNVARGSGGLERKDGDWSLSLSGSGNGIGLPGEFAALITTSEQLQAFEANLDLGIWQLSELISLAGLSAVDGADALSVGTSFRLVTNAQTGLEEIEAVLARESGILSLLDGKVEVSGIDAWLTYRPQSDILDINRLALVTNKLEGVFEGALSNLLSENPLQDFSLSSEAFRVDGTPYFPQAWNFKQSEIRGQISNDYSVFSIERFVADYGDLNFSAAGDLDLGVKADAGEIPFALDITVELVGQAGKETVLSFWPVTLGDGGRRFVRERLQRGVLNGATVVASIKPDSRSQGFLRDEDLEVNFGFRDGRVLFLTDMPPVRDAIGTGRLTGNSFSVDVVEANYDDWSISAGRFDFPALNPRGEDFIVTATGQGPAVSILRQLSNSRMRLQENTGFDPERVSGQAQATLRLQRPSTGEVLFEDINIKVNGAIRDAGLADVVFGQSMANGRVEVDMTQERLLLSGYGDLGPVPIQFSWRDGLDNDGRPADLSASGIINPAVLNELGLFGRAYLTGDVPVDVQGQVSGEGLGEAQFAFDLRGARVSIDEIGWTKPAGEAARAVIKYAGEGGTSASSVRLESEKAVVDGDIILQPDGRLQSLDLRRLFVDGMADVSGQIRRMPNGGASMVVEGAYLNLEPILGGFGDLEGAEQTGPGIPLEIKAKVDRLRLRRGLDMIDANASLSSAADRLLSAEAVGKTVEGDAFSAGYSDDREGGPRIILEADNAGFLAQAFLGLDFIQDGSLKLTGTLGEGRKPSRFLAEVSDARLINAPFVTQILSLASLRGLSDTLSGDGVLFTSIRAPISVGGGRYVIDGGRASGPALGLTLNGWIATNGEGIELDGVLVPSFGVNSALGGVPVIGDLFVGRKGEGIFSITYSVRGTLERAQVAVNPLSAVTPGILRRIFENPSDTSIPQSIAVDPNLKPPSELPELPDDEVITPTPDAG